jgi:hypothetical protein
MSVYIDNARIFCGRMRMSHMVADSKHELLDMAERIGLKRHWLQKEGTPWEHFDVCRSKRVLAVQLGAVEVDGRQIVSIVLDRRTRVTEEKP